MRPSYFFEENIRAFAAVSFSFSRKLVRANKKFLDEYLSLRAQSRNENGVKAASVGIVEMFID